MEDSLEQRLNEALDAIERVRRLLDNVQALREYHGYAKPDAGLLPIRIIRAALEGTDAIRYDHLNTKVRPPSESTPDPSP